MKKFLLLYLGDWEKTPENMQGWGAWFEANAESFVDSGNPLGAGRAVTAAGASDLGGDGEPPITGYSLIQAEDMAAAERLLDDLPIMHSIRIYEAMPM